MANDRAIPAGRMICTGDVVAYCAQPNETLRVFLERGIPCVAGNCEAQLIENAEDCGCGFEAGTTCDVLSVGWYGYALPRIDADARTWMASLPEK